MNAKPEIKEAEAVVAVTHKNVWTALAAAQSQMGKLVKDALNPHFKSKYADLADVMAAALPALNTNGLAMYHQITNDGHTMRTVLMHGESETAIECDVPLIVAQNNMQGFKSATTYAKRIGAESVTGLAPDDDDGNAAAAAPPAAKSSASLKRNGEWDRVKTELDKDMLDCKSLVALETLRNDYRQRIADCGWPNAWKAALKDIFDSKEDEIQAADHPINAG